MSRTRLILAATVILALASFCPALAATPEDDPLGGWIALDNVWATDEQGGTNLDASGLVAPFADITRIRARIDADNLVIEFYVLDAKSDGTLKFAVFVDWGTAGDPPADNFDYENLLSTQNYDYHLQRESDKPYFDKLAYLNSGHIKADNLGSTDTAVGFTPNAQDGQDLLTCTIPLAVFPNNPGGNPTRISIITQSTQDAPRYTIPLFGAVAVPGALVAMLAVRRIRIRQAR